MNCINSQDYPHELIQWVVIDDSDNEEKCQKPDQAKTDISIKYIKLDKKLKLGEKRNLSHTHCDGKIIVYMDDDDYYFPQRVSHAVARIKETGKEVAGATYLIIYYSHDDQVWTSGPFGKNHATAGTFAMTKEFANKTFYQKNDETGEESAFLAKYTKEMAQLNHTKTMICIAHSSNTFDKRLCRTLGNKNQIKRMEAKQEKQCITILSNSGHRKQQKPSQSKLESFPLILVCGAWGSGTTEISCFLEGLGIVFPEPYIESDSYYKGKSRETASFRESILKFVQEENLIPPTEKDEITNTLSNNKLELFKDRSDEFRYGLCAPTSSAVLKELESVYSLTIIFCLRDYQSIDREARALNWPEHFDWEGASIINNQCLNFLATTNSRYTILRYKDIYEKPAAVSNALCKFVGLNKNKNQIHSASLMLRKFRTNSKKTKAQSDTVKSNLEATQDDSTQLTKKKRKQ